MRSILARLWNIFYELLYWNLYWNDFRFCNRRLASYNRGHWISIENIETLNSSIKPSMFSFSISMWSHSFIHIAHLDAFQCAYAWVNRIFLMHPVVVFLFYSIKHTHVATHKHSQTFAHKFGHCVLMRMSEVAPMIFDGNWEGTIRRTQSNMHWCVDVPWSNVIPYKLHHLLTNSQRSFLFGIYSFFTFSLWAPSSYIYKLIAKHQSNFMWVYMFVCCYKQTGDRWQSANNSNDLSIRHCVCYRHLNSSQVKSISICLSIFLLLPSHSLSAAYFLSNSTTAWSNNVIIWFWTLFYVYTTHKVWIRILNKLLLLL